MKERKIKMTPEEVKDFVNKASQCDFDIDIFYNHFIIDAKSILGVMGLEFNSTLTVKCYCYSTISSDGEFLHNEEDLEST